MRKQHFCLCENKGADQLCSNWEADQRLCFRYTDSNIPTYTQNFKNLAFFCDCTGWFLSGLVRNPKGRFSNSSKPDKQTVVGLTIDANFDYRDNIAIVEITITILSLSWHTITMLSRYYRFFTKLSLKGVYLEQSRKLSPFSAVG